MVFQDLIRVSDLEQKFDLVDKKKVMYKLEQYADLKEKYKTLIKDYAKLSEEHRLMIADFDKLSSKLAKTKRKVKKLQDELDELTGNHNQQQELVPVEPLVDKPEEPQNKGGINLQWKPGTRPTVTTPTKHKLDNVNLHVGPKGFTIDLDFKKKNK